MLYLTYRVNGNVFKGLFNLEHAPTITPLTIPDLSQLIGTHTN